MQYKIDYPQKDTAVITADFDAAEWQKYMDNAKAKLGAEADEQKIKDFAISTAAADVAAQAMDKDGLQLATAPVVAGDEKDGAMEMVLNCQLLPEVKLGQYTGYDLEVKPDAVTEEELLAEIDHRINAEKIWSTLPSDQAAKDGDRVIINFVGKKDGVAFQGGTGENYPLVLGSKSFIPSFEEALVGMKAGETKDIDITFPADYFEKSLAGQPVVFEVKVNEVQQEVKPELTEEFLKKMGIEGIKSVDEFKEKVLAEMKGLKQQEAENKMLSELLAKISDGTEIDIPQEMIDRQVDQHVQQLENQMRQYQMGLEQYLEMTGLDLAQLKDNLQPQAILEIRQGLILDAIAAKENIAADQNEIMEEYKLLSSIYGMPAAQLQAFVPAGAIAAQITHRKALDFLKENNTKKA